MASRQQIKIGEMLVGIVNYRIGRKSADIALPNENVLIEYDSWYWHGHKVQEDRQRAQELIDLGWCVLTIKSNMATPTIEQIRAGIERAKQESYFEIILDDWGRGCIKAKEKNED